MAFFKKIQKVLVDEARINELLTRGVERIYPSKEALEAKLKSGESLRIYTGIDPTGPTLHFGHLIPLLKLQQFQLLGHKIILLIGDFTATIGDPSDKMAARVPLSEKEVLKNAQDYKKQASRVIAFSGRNQATLKYNSTWLNKLSMIEVGNLLRNITYAQTIKRDMFQRRLAEGKDLYVNEFLYPLFQGYDSVAMDVDAEVGGNDQTFNMLMGRDLLKRMKNKEKFVIAMKLLVDSSSGKKMGKTEGNMVTMEAIPTDMFGKIMSWPDSMILSGFELCTRVPLQDIEMMKAELEHGENPKNLKLRLAEEITSLIHGATEAKKARVSFDATFSERKPQDFTEVARQGDPLTTLIEKGVVSSKTELRRLIAAGAITLLDSNTKVGEDFIVSFPIGKYRIGKHRFIEIKENL